MSSYAKGLDINDLVTFKTKIFLNQLSKSKTALVLDKNYLFQNETKYGIKSFFNYKVLDIQNNRVYDIATRDISVINVIKGSK